MSFRDYFLRNPTQLNLTCTLLVFASRLTLCYLVGFPIGSVETRAEVVQSGLVRSYVQRHICHGKVPKMVKGC